MEISINALLERVDIFLSERATWAWHRATGAEAPTPLAALHARFPELSRTESWAAVREAAENPRADEATRLGLARLLTFVAQVMVEARSAEHLDAREAWLGATTVSAGSRTLSVAGALDTLPREANPETRHAFEREVAARLADHQAPWARAVDTVQHTAADLGFANPRSFVERLAGRDLAAQAQQAQALLTSTDDAYGDLLAYNLRRLGAPVKPGHATLADVAACARAPWLTEQFRKPDLQHAVTRCFEDLGLDPAVGGRVSMQVESRPVTRGGSRVCELQVPDDVRLYLELADGTEALAQWLNAWGVAQHRARAQRSLPLLDRRVGDRAVVDAVGRLFESCLADEGFLRRYARLPQAQAREAARLFAFRQLLALRRTAALVPVSLELLERGPVRPLMDTYADHLGQALHATVPPGRFLLDVDPLVPGAVELDAWALETAAHAHLLERFNEDYWRNPATGRWLEATAAGGLRDDAQTVAKGLGVEKLDLLAAGARRVRVMGA